MDFLEMQGKVKKNADIHADEKKYYLLKEHFPIIQEKFAQGKISKESYEKQKNKLAVLEKKYG